jgi:hypothetical protein
LIDRHFVDRRANFRVREKNEYRIFNQNFLKTDLELCQSVDTLPPILYLASLSNCLERAEPLMPIQSKQTPSYEEIKINSQLTNSSVSVIFFIFYHFDSRGKSHPFYASVRRTNKIDTLALSVKMVEEEKYE